MQDTKTNCPKIQTITKMPAVNDAQQQLKHAQPADFRKGIFGCVQQCKSVEQQRSRCYQSHKTQLYETEDKQTADNHGYGYAKHKPDTGFAQQRDSLLFAFDVGKNERTDERRCKSEDCQ